MPQNFNNIDQTVLKTLKSIGNELRMQKFILRGTIKRKREFEAQEIETRIKIKNLIHKLEWEMDFNNRLNELKDKKD